MSITSDRADEISRSSNDECVCEYLEWSKSYTGAASWPMYSVLIFTAAEMTEWLSRLPPDQVRDTGILGDQEKNRTDRTVKEPMKRHSAKKCADDMSAHKEELQLKAPEMLCNFVDEKKTRRELIERDKWTFESDDDGKNE